MRMLTTNRAVSPTLLLTFLALLVTQAASARAGAVDYSWGASALAKAHDFTVTMMLYVVYICYAVGSIVAVISALIIYIKIQYQEGQVLKNVMTLIGAGLFMVGATIVFPAFFGYRI
ncbi:MAG: DUF4134 family protein [Candidatus Methanomethylophilaceae archaeon]|nr:DUF4134 family protein [Candidatus Methanomethylophilaceae archaeon]